MIGVVLALLIVPLVAGLMCFALAARVAAAVTVVSGVVSFALVLAVVPAAAHHDLSYLSYLRVDAVSAIFLLATGFLYGAVEVTTIISALLVAIDDTAAAAEAAWKYVLIASAGLGLALLGTVFAYYAG